MRSVYVDSLVSMFMMSSARARKANFSYCNLGKTPEVEQLAKNGALMKDQERKYTLRVAVEEKKVEVTFNLTKT